jgi:hypothetical protein
VHGAGAFMGAVDAAKTILVDDEVLPVTRWLHEGFTQFTLEREIEQLRWADLCSGAS